MELASIDAHTTQSSFGTLAAETELRHFLKLARPEWSKPKRRGRSDVVRVQEKLKAIGIRDIDTLIKMVDKNTINEELYNRGLVPLSRDSLDSIRKQKTFIQALESVDVPNIRQVGTFDPVAQMLSRSSLHGSQGSRRNASKKGGPIGSEDVDKEGSPAKTRLLRRPAIFQEEADMQPEALIPPWPRLKGVVHRERWRKTSGSASTPGLLLPRMAPGLDRSLSHGLMSPGAGHSQSLPAGRLDRLETDPMEPSRASKRLANTIPPHTDAFGGQGSPLSRSDSYRATVPPSMTEMLAMQRAGQRMLDSLEDPQSSAAKWSPKSTKTPLEQGEDMLQEQGALDERERLVRVVKSKSLPPDPFRSHIALNIKQRMEECAHNDSKEGLAINQRCLNIRKQLAGMVNARKELAGLRAKVHLLMEEPILPRLILESQNFTDKLHDIVHENQ